MNLQCLGTQVIAAAPVLFVSMGAVSNAQVSATRVAAEMTYGRSNPAESKPGDTDIAE
jgi:hypothetical protein